MTNSRTSLPMLLVLLLAIPFAAKFAIAETNPQFEHVLISTPKPYNHLASIITSLGGHVTHQFTYVDGIAADIPAGSISTLRSLSGNATISKDVDVPAPHSVDSYAMRGVAANQAGPAITAKTKSTGTIQSAVLPAFAGAHPEAYSLNNAGTRIGELQASGLTGNGTIVAVVDSGYRPGFQYLDNDTSVIGGIDFVGDGKGFSNLANDGHGTFVAGLISGNGTFTLDGPLLDAVREYAPTALDPATGQLALLGTAPDAKLYVVRVFGTDASRGAPISRIIAAVQHVIDLRTEYNNSGGAHGLKIDVCNLSLGVFTINAGRSLLDRSVDALLAAGIVPVVSAGNTGPSSLTIASPGSSMSAVTVGGISQAANDRIIAELVHGPGTGALYQPTTATQTAWFSSRGPNADGRLDPDVVASAMGNFAQGYCPTQVQDACDGDLSIASGTSYSAPIIAGIAAVLRQAFPGASATQIRNSIIDTARTNLVEDGSSDIDRGNGVPDAVAAFNLLASGGAPDYLPAPPNPDEEVERNVERSTDLTVYSGNVRLNTGRLKPGQRFDVLYNVEPGTESVVVSLDNFSFSLPVAQQNQLFGHDDLFVNIHSAKTSSIGSTGDYAVGFYTDLSPFVFADSQFNVGHPDTGIMRITLVGDFINAGKVSAAVNVHSVHEPISGATASGVVHDGERITIPVQIPARVQSLEFVVSWKKDWGHYPTSDVDVTIIDPNGKVLVNRSGTQPAATLASPERAPVDHPKKGVWQVIVQGFDIPSGSDDYELRVMADGIVLNP